MRFAPPAAVGCWRVFIVLRTGRREAIALVENLCKHRVEEAEDVVVLEPDDVKPGADQPLRPRPIVLVPLAVRFPVQLDDEPRFRTEEVRDERRKRLLATELVAAKLTVAQALPQSLLGRRRRVSHRAGALEQHGRDVMPTSGRHFRPSKMLVASRTARGMISATLA